MRLALDLSLPTAPLKGGGGFAPAAFLAAYPAFRWWSPRQLALAEAAAIAQVNDLSANANHWLQATGAAQPSFDATLKKANLATSKHMALAGTAALNIGSVTKLTVIAAIRHVATATAVLLEQGNPATGSGGYGVYLNNGPPGTGAIGGGVGNGANRVIYNAAGAGAVPRNYVASITFDTTLPTTEQVAIRIDGIDMPTVAAVAPVGTVSGDIYSGAQLRIGARAGTSLFLNSFVGDVLVCPNGVPLADLEPLEAHLFNENGF